MTSAASRSTYMSVFMLLATCATLQFTAPSRPFAAPRAAAGRGRLLAMDADAVEAPPEGYVPVAADGSCPLPPEETYYCNEQGCWVGAPPVIEPVVLPDGRTFCMDLGVQSHKQYDAEEQKKARRPAPTGLFAPLVVGAKRVMGEKDLNALRADVIVKHSKVIGAFVDTSESRFGQLVLRQMFEAADKDGNGTLDRREVRDALHALGFTFIEDKQLDKIFSRADENDDLVIDFEEFIKETPKTLRTSLVKLAKAPPLPRPTLNPRASGLESAPPRPRHRPTAMTWGFSLSRLRLDTVLANSAVIRLPHAACAAPRVTTYGRSVCGRAAWACAWAWCTIFTRRARAGRCGGRRRVSRPIVACLSCHDPCHVCVLAKLRGGCATLCAHMCHIRCH